MFPNKFLGERGLCPPKQFLMTAKTILMRYDGTGAEFFHEGTTVRKRLLMPEARKAAGELFKKLQAADEEEADCGPGPR